ncbi:Rieske (2Fe-2S) protein [Streptomyces sp. SD15]
MTKSPARRTVLGSGAAVLGTGAATLLVGCSNYDDSDSGSDKSPAPASPEAAVTSAAPTTSAAAAAGTELAKTSDIPVGGGKIFKDKKVVVTQPTANEFKCFSAVCTHQGCTVGSVANGSIVCPCHNSKFSIEDASVQGGPATKPLPAEQITVEGNSILLT